MLTSKSTYPILSRQFPEFFSEEITEISVMYMLRNAFSFYSRDNNYEIRKAEYEKEFLKLLSENNFNPYAKDIDGNILLTYPIHLSAHKLVDKMLWSKNPMYDLTQQNKLLTDALVSAIPGNNIKDLKKIINYPGLSKDYPKQLAISILGFYPLKPERYQGLFDILDLSQINHTDLFKELFEHEIKSDFKYIPAQTFLNIYPISLQEKKVLLQSEFDSLEENKVKNPHNWKHISKNTQEKISILKIFLEKLTLDTEYLVPLSNSVVKIQKI